MIAKIPTFLLALFFVGCAGSSMSAPRWEGSTLDSIVERSVLTLTFSGDVMQHLPQVDAARKADGTYDYTASFQYIKPFWEQADFAIVNLETTLSERGPYRGYPSFASPTALAGGLKGAGVDVAAMANNHCCDGGLKGILTTLRTLDSLNIQHTGVYADTISDRHPLILKRKGFRVALLNCTYGTNGIPVPRGAEVCRIDTMRLRREIGTARRDSATHMILFAHWGEEYQRRPNREQKMLAEWCRAEGVDVVIGSHPHVAQPIDTAERVVWSLGNLVSNQRNRYQDGGLSVRVTLSMSAPPVIESLPHWVWTPIEEGRRRHYVVPAYASPERMDSVSKVLLHNALEDNRAVAGGVDEVVLWR